MDLRFVARAVFLALVGLLALTLSQHILFVNSRHDLGIDFAVFERAARATSDLVYQPHRAPFAYPPTALILLKPLTALGYWVWAAVSCAIFGIGVALTCGKKVAALSFLSPPVLKGLVQGQVSLLLGGLLFLGLRVQPLLGGAFWGVAATVKPQMMLFAPVALAVRRDWSMLSGMVVGAICMIVASLAFLDATLWLRWLEALANFHELIERGAMTKVISPAGQAVMAGLPAFPFIVGGLALGGAAVFFMAPKVEGAHLIALILAASIVASPYAHLYEATALIPACVILVFHGRWLYAIPAGLICTGLLQLTMMALIFILVAATFEGALKNRAEGNARSRQL